VLVAWFGFADVARTALSIGFGGFVLLAGWQLLLFALLGAAWNAIMPPLSRSLPRLVWGRMVRDAAANCLPFSPVGGFLLGTRAVSLAGVATSVAAASTIVDVTMELLAQALFAALGLAILFNRRPDADFVAPLIVGLAATFAVILVFLRVQRGSAPIFARLSRQLGGRWFGSAEAGVAMLQVELALMHRRPGHLVLCSVLHFLGWIGTACEGWLALRLVGAHVDFPGAIAIEALLRAVLAAAFVVPGNAGVQEAAYVGFGAIFGVPSELAIAASLIRRARDLAVGLPILLAWQALEARAMTPGRRLQPVRRSGRDRPA
jgi:putative membrane protein